jgi:phosphate uptake regulator
MERKLIKQGLGGYTIYLPKKWLDMQGLDKGGEISIEESENSLIILASKQNKKSETQITLHDVDETSIRTLITNVYRKGYDKIQVLFENEKQFSILEDVIRKRLIGFDIVKKEKNKCIVENITEPSPDQFDNILSKVFLNISSLFEITRQRFNGKKPEENFEEVEARIMQYDNFCRRVISKRHIIDKKSEFFWAFLHLIDHGQREIYHLNRLSSLKVSQKTKELLDDCEKMFNLIQESYAKKDIFILTTVHGLDNEAFYKKGYSLLEKTKGKETIIVYHLMASLRKFFQTNSPLTGLLI